MRKLVPTELRSRWRDEKIESKKFSCSTFMLYLGSKNEVEHLEHHNVFLTNDYRQNLIDIGEKHRLSENPSFYVCNPAKTDPTMAPEGKSSLYVLVPITHQHPNVDWQKEAPSYRKLVLNQLGKLGVKDIESRIEYEKMITPATWESDYEIYKGTVFNLAHSLDQMLFLRPQNRFKELDSVYLVGSGTHPGSGLPVIYESALISSRLIAKDLGYTPA